MIRQRTRNSIWVGPRIDCGTGSGSASHSALPMARMTLSSSCAMDSRFSPDAIRAYLSTSETGAKSYREVARSNEAAAEVTDRLLDTLEARIGTSFTDRTLLVRALTHHSVCPETAQRDAYDTLEFLGDALISAYVVEHLFHTYPKCHRRRVDRAEIGGGQPEGVRADRTQSRPDGVHSR